MMLTVNFIKSQKKITKNREKYLAKVEYPANLLEA